MAVTMGMVFGDTVGLVVGGVTVAGRAMAVGNRPPMVRSVGFAAEPNQPRNEPVFGTKQTSISTLNMSAFGGLPNRLLSSKEAADRRKRCFCGRGYRTGQVLPFGSADL
jgi:hypothetical protein